MAASIICQDLIEKLGYPKQSYSVSVDGTSATGKTTLVNGVANLSGKRCTKVSREHAIKNTNSCGVSMLSYAMCGIKMMNIERIVLDRSPLNCIEWFLLWTMLHQWNAKFGNMRFDESNKLHCDMLEYFKQMFKSLMNNATYKTLRSKFNGFSIIGSDWNACDFRRTRRNNGSDARRSTFKIYSFMQNVMYSELYPGQCIDIDWYTNTYNLKDILEGISMYISMSLNGNTPPTMDMRSWPRFKKPQNPNDIFEMTLRTDAERMLARVEHKFQSQFLEGASGEVLSREEIFERMCVSGVGYHLAYRIIPTTNLELDRKPSDILNYKHCDGKIININIEAGTDTIGPVIDVIESAEFEEYNMEDPIDDSELGFDEDGQDSSDSEVVDYDENSMDATN